MGQSIQIILGAAAAVALMARLHAVLFPAAGWHRHWTADVSLYLFLSVSAPAFLARLPPSIEPGPASSVSFLWLPIEWHKYPMNISLIASTYPRTSLALGGAMVVGIVSLTVLGTRRTSALAAGAFTFFMLGHLGPEEMGFRSPFFQVVLAGPFALLSLAAWRNMPRACARLLVPAWSQAVLCLFYTGVSDPEGRESPLPQAVSVVYPAEGRQPDLPLHYVRRLYVDSRLGALFASFGPTSGLAKLDLESGRMQILPTRGLIRGFWSDDDDPLLYAVEWIHDDLWLVDKKTFKVVRIKRLLDGTLVAPIDVVVHHNRIFVVSTEMPALTAFDRTTLDRVGQVDFRKLGLTRFKSGAWVAALDPSSDRIFVEIGMTDRTDRFKLLRMSTDTLEIDGQAEIPFGGLQMLAVPGKRSLLIPDFYSDRIAEIDMDTLTLKRMLKSTLNARTLAFDERAGIVLAASFMNGRFEAVDFSSGASVLGFWAGKKPSHIFIPPGSTSAYLASTRGFLRLNLASFTAPP